MINRANYKLYRSYLAHLRDAGQHEPSSLQVKSWRLKWVLRWLDAVPIERAPRVKPTLPRFLADAKKQPGYNSRVLVDARLFFRWLRGAHANRFHAITDAWVDSMKPIKSTRPAADHQAVTLDMVRAILALPRSPDDLLMWRDQAACAMLFLSGMRVGAFVTLPISCVDLAARTISQDPARGVRTKNRKAAVTHLLEIPDLLAFVAAWDAHIRKLAPTGAWYVIVSPVTREIVPGTPGAHRAQILRRGITCLFVAAGLPPMSPHKFRHGHATHAIGQARDVADLKAISQNLAHSSLTITDQIYAILDRDDVRTRIARLGGSPPSADLADIPPELAADIQAAITAVLARHLGKKSEGA